jgi:hypothetical protein
VVDGLAGVIATNEPLRGYGQRPRSHPAHPGRSHQVGAVTVESDIPRRRGERVVPGEVAALNSALAESRYRQQSTCMATRGDQLEELAEGVNPGVLRRIGRHLVDRDDRYGVAIVIGAGDQERTGPQFADSDDGGQESEGVQLAGEGGDGVHVARYWSGAAVDC